MRFAASLLLWLITTAALAVAIPAGWMQRHVIDADGYVTLAQHAATDPALQSAVAAQLSTQATVLITERGGTVDDSLVRQVAAGYTSGPDFPGQFAHVNRIAHRWMFTTTADGEQLTVDVAPMLNDTAFHQFLDHYDVSVPATVTVPVTAVPPDLPVLRPGRLRLLRVWGPAISIGAAALTAIAAAGTLILARRRGTALAALGVSALLVGGAGWAGIEVGRGYLGELLTDTTGDIRRIADVMVGHAVGSAHQWLNLTLATGGALVVVGMFAAVLGGLRRHEG
ncbi:MAG TPA: hypothetical protein VL179_11090 [Mycobacterium sp.]|nr:hypothetical protein [Mycobacterium sp.]